MTIEAWKRERIDEWPYCEMAHLFRNCGFKWFTEEVWSGRGKVMAPAHEWHHVLGGSAGRKNHPWNLLHLNFWVHLFCTNNANAGRVLSFAALRDAGRLDWDYSSHLARPRQFPGCLDTDPYIEACEPFAWLEELRVNLLRKAV